MKKRSLLIVVALLCMASLMAAMAFTSATVTSAASFKVSNTNEALLALTAGEHGAASYTGGHKSNSKSLVIDWAKGFDDDYGVQLGSIYTWDNLFNVKNNSERAIEVSISVPEVANIGSIVKIKTDDSESWVTIASRHTSKYGTLTFELQPGDDVWVDSQIDSMQGSISNGDRNFTLKVDAVAVGQVQ